MRDGIDKTRIRPEKPLISLLRRGVQKHIDIIRIHVINIFQIIAVYVHEPQRAVNRFQQLTARETDDLCRAQRLGALSKHAVPLGTEILKIHLTVSADKIIRNVLAVFIDDIRPQDAGNQKIYVF